MIRKIYTLLILGLCLGFAACSDDNDGLDPNAAAPVIKFPMEQLDVDLNKVVKGETENEETVKKEMYLRQQ